MTKVAITGTGLFTPAESISNDELVACYNAYVERFNAENAADIAAGSVTALAPSSSEFILKASGIQSRYVVEKAGVLDITRMCPRIRTRRDDEPSLMVEIGLAAARLHFDDLLDLLCHGRAWKKSRGRPRGKVDEYCRFRPVLSTL